MISNNVSQNENGFVLVLALLLMLILTILGIFSTRTAITELQISGNEREVTDDFYVSESAWRLGALWVDNLVKVPLYINTTDDGIIRNYGDGGKDEKYDYENLPDNSKDGTLGSTKYWYRVKEDGSKKSPGSGKGYRAFSFIVDGVANKRTSITTRVDKLYYVGYGN